MALKLQEIAARIDTHLKRMEADPEINPRHKDRMSRMFNSYAKAKSNGLWIRYNTITQMHNGYRLYRPEAEAYLAYLDAGGTAEHHEALQAWRESQPKPQPIRQAWAVSGLRAYKIEVFSETNKTINWRYKGYNGVDLIKSNKIRGGFAFYDTWAEAHDLLISKAESTVIELQEKIEKARKRLDEVEKMREPE